MYHATVLCLPVSISRIRALVVIDWHEKYLEEFWKVVPDAIASGELKSLEHVVHGLKETGKGFVDMMTGANIGKTVIVIEN